MQRKSLGFFAVLAFFALPAHADKGCKVERFAELPVTMSGTKPMVTGTINGQKAFFMADSGAFFSTLTNESAAKFHLKQVMLPPGMFIRGTGGTEDAHRTTAKDFTLTGFLGGREIHNIDFVVMGNGLAGESDGLIGQNIIGGADTEYDLANGVIRLFRSKDCNDHNLAYWHGTADVGVINIEKITASSPHIIGDAKINCKKIRVVFDSGAWRSILNLKTASRVGITPDGEDVTAGGISRGLGRRATETSIARFDSLDLGGELIKNARLRIGEILIAQGADMLLGADFFLSHRIYVAHNQHKVFFTYNGGSVFDLSTGNKDNRVANTSDAATNATAPATALASPDNTATAAAGELSQPNPSQSNPSQSSSNSKDAPLDAEGFRRRGAALAGRYDFGSAIADFDQAIKLDPANAENFYQRGLAHWQNRQPMKAMNDFDAALKVNPDHVPSLMQRGTLRLAKKDEAGARADLDAATRLSPRDPSLHLRTAQTFSSYGYYDESITRLDAWIAANPKDERVLSALLARCLSRTMAGKELDIALADCNTVVKRGSRSSQLFDARGLVFLKLGNFDKSIADYEASLKLQPKGANSLYGLGLAELKKGLKSEGESHIRAAQAIDPKIADTFKRASLTP